MGYTDTRNKTGQAKVDGSTEREGGENSMKDIRTIRRAVATMANQLHKLGYSLSQAFRTAWRRVKGGMRIRVSCVTQGKRQELLQFIAGRKPEDLTVYLQRDRANLYDKYAVAVVIGIKDIGYAHIGYLPRNLSQGMAAVIEAGVQVRAELLQVIGGYSYKETLGALVGIEV